LVKSDGQLDKVLHEHTQRGLFVARLELSEGIDCLIIMIEDMVKFEAIGLLLKHSYLLVVFHHAGVAVIRLPIDLVDNKLRVALDVKPLDPELGGDAQAVDEGLILRHIVTQKCCRIT
jgi:hypothetical protein